MQYATLSWVQAALTGHQQKGANAAEAKKLTKLNREIHLGERTALPAGFRFVPVAMTSRGVRGKQLEQLLEWLADYGATNRGVLSYLRGGGGGGGEGETHPPLEAASVCGDSQVNDGGGVGSDAGDCGGVRGIAGEGGAHGR